MSPWRVDLERYVTVPYVWLDRPRPLRVEPPTESRVPRGMDDDALRFWGIVFLGLLYGLAAILS